MKKTILQRTVILANATLLVLAAALVVKIDKTQAPLFFTTQGDANSIADTQPVAFERIQGVYAWHVPYLGRLLEFIKAPVGIALFVLLPTLVLAIKEIQTIVSILVEKRIQSLTQREEVNTL